MGSTSPRCAPHRWDHGFAVLGCALLILAAAARPAGAEMQPSVRQGWLVGLGLGGGSAGISGGGWSSDRKAGFAGSVRVGYAFQSRLSLELSTIGWAKEENGTWLAFSASGPAVSYYPGGGGLVLSAGFGAGSAEASAQAGNVTVTTSESGFGVFGGVGYEFRVTRRFALGPQVHAGWIDLDGFNGNWVGGELGAHWYFIPR
jgi:hypothetical protein